MQKKAILCVDDEKIVLDSLKSQIKRRFSCSFNCEIASSINEANDVIEDLVINNTDILIIVSDCIMPGIKGDEFLVNIHKRFPNIIKVMLSEITDSEAIKNAIKNANLYACINKPWKEDDLFRIIESALEVMKR